MNKTLIGYKLIKPEYEESYKIIANVTDSTLYNNTYHFIKGSIVYNNLKNAGVLDLWFEPVIVHSSPDITINNYEGEFFDTYVKFGSAEISKHMFLDLYACRGYPNNNREIESITIGKRTFNKEQIKQIAEYYLNKL